VLGKEFLSADAKIGKRKKRKNETIETNYVDNKSTQIVKESR
jgi:hypothetical protein